ncbi:MAG: hypothetical protein V4568_08325 [Pseudomonadota bacterium]
MYIYARLNQDKASPYFLSTSYIGEGVWNKKTGEILLKKACLVYEEMVQIFDKASKLPMGTKIESRYLTNSFVSNGAIPLRESDCLFVREVEESDEALVGYNSAVEALRLEQINIKKASVVPQAPLASRGQPSQEVRGGRHG